MKQHKQDSLHNNIYLYLFSFTYQSFLEEGFPQPHPEMMKLNEIRILLHVCLERLSVYWLCSLYMWWRCIDWKLDFRSAAHCKISCPMLLCSFDPVVHSTTNFESQYIFVSLITFSEAKVIRIQASWIPSFHCLGLDPANTQNNFYGVMRYEGCLLHHYLWSFNLQLNQRTHKEGNYLSQGLSQPSVSFVFIFSHNYFRLLSVCKRLT